MNIYYTESIKRIIVVYCLFVSLSATLLCFQKLFMLKWSNQNLNRKQRKLNQHFFCIINFCRNFFAKNEKKKNLFAKAKNREEIERKKAFGKKFSLLIDSEGKKKKQKTFVVCYFCKIVLVRNFLFNVSQHKYSTQHAKWNKNNFVNCKANKQCSESYISKIYSCNYKRKQTKTYIPII